MDQEDKKVEDRIDKLEKALLNAIVKYNPHALVENEKSPGQEERWTDHDQSQPPPLQLTNFAHPPERQSNWSGRGHEGQLQLGYRNQDQANWGNKNQNNPGNSYVPPHQRNNQGNFQNSQQNHQGNQGSGGQYNNQGSSNQYNNHQGNFRQNQGQGQNFGQSNFRPQRSLDDMVHDLVNSQQFMQGNLHSHNDMVHKLQDAQSEQKAAMDMMAKQLSQIAVSLNEMQGNEGKLPATVKPPDRANISQITLRSGRGYEGPTLETDEEVPMQVKEGKQSQKQQEGGAEPREIIVQRDLQKEDLGGSLPRPRDPFFLDPEPEEDGCYQGRDPASR
ncbi:bifunctional endo-1,4-beta-xylanase XylA-like [Salvia hispanica]|uniref:bifunctional endo-1,4-beta-xylanase XylA-like n=1 Tax=Salvia hispanica TaxID=49212 RepID=UPI002009BAD6|nr:bifunctional endo-1,4-beta-xylanase XylA-like [Salvia hispanica]